MKISRVSKRLSPFNPSTFLTVLCLFLTCKGLCALPALPNEACPDDMELKKRAEVVTEDTRRGEMVSKAFQSWTKEKAKHDTTKTVGEVIREAIPVSPRFFEMLEAVTPEAMGLGIFPGPIEFSKRLDKWLEAPGVPLEERPKIGRIVIKKAEGKNQYKILGFSEPIPEGYSLLQDSAPLHVYYEALNRNIVPVEWSGKRDDRFNMLMFYHDLHHLAAMTHSDYRAACRKLSGYLVAKYKAHEIRFTNHTNNRLGVQDFFEEFWVLPQEWSAKIDLSLDPDTQNAWDALYKKNSILNDRINRLHYGEKKSADDQKLLQDAYAERAALVEEFRGITSHFQSRLIEALRILNTYRHNFGAAIADGISFQTFPYETRGPYGNILFRLKQTLSYFDESGYRRSGVPQRTFGRVDEIISGLLKSTSITPMQAADFYINLLQKEIDRSDRYLIYDEDGIGGLFKSATWDE